MSFQGADRRRVGGRKFQINRSPEHIAKTKPDLQQWNLLQGNKTIQITTAKTKPLFAGT
jgi:hypothetical protein